jgi:hypothetical protein
MSDERAMMSEPSGSVSRVNKDREVKTVAVSSAALPSLFCAMTEKTAKARIGDAMGEMYAA